LTLLPTLIRGHSGKIYAHEMQAYVVSISAATLFRPFPVANQ